jgi:hypothetical protein
MTAIHASIEGKARQRLIEDFADKLGKAVTTPHGRKRRAQLEKIVKTANYITMFVTTKGLTSAAMSSMGIATGATASLLNPGVKTGLTAMGRWAVANSGTDMFFAAAEGKKPVEMLHIGMKSAVIGASMGWLFDYALPLSFQKFTTKNLNVKQKEVLYKTLEKTSNEQKFAAMNRKTADYIRKISNDASIPEAVKKQLIEEKTVSAASAMTKEAARVKRFANELIKSELEIRNRRRLFRGHSIQNIV